MDSALYLLPHIQSLVEATRLIGKSLDRIATVLEKEQTKNAADPQQSILDAALRAAQGPVTDLLVGPPRAKNKDRSYRQSKRKTPPFGGQR